MEVYSQERQREWITMTVSIEQENERAGSSDVRLSMKQYIDMWADGWADMASYCALVLYSCAKRDNDAVPFRIGLL
jgi:hypothetical protein